MDAFELWSYDVSGTVGGFIGLKYLIFAAFYTNDETPIQSFEIWTGTLKEG